MIRLRLSPSPCVCSTPRAWFDNTTEVFLSVGRQKTGLKPMSLCSFMHPEISPSTLQRHPDIKRPCSSHKMMSCKTVTGQTEYKSEKIPGRIFRLKFLNLWFWVLFVWCLLHSGLVQSTHLCCWKHLTSAISHLWSHLLDFTASPCDWPCWPVWKIFSLFKALAATSV